MNQTAEQARAAGVVGAGGAGFPTYVKLNSTARYFIANGAECEPLLHKDKELMLAHGDEILAGLRLSVEAVGATHVYFAAKKKYPDSFNLMKKKTDGTGYRMLPLGNFYPSGDEYELVWEATRQLIPPGGIPLQVDTVVNNVETLYNLARAEQGEPVVDTFMTVNGAVREPGTFRVPVGCSLADVVEAAGGATVGDPAALFNGAMMGSVETEFEKTIITKTSSGAIIVPGNLSVVRRKAQPVEEFSHIGKSTCDQCSLCTQMCPRYLLGYAVEPHTVMRSLGFTATHNPLYDRFGLLCCECNICSLYACPEDLNPKQVCVQAKLALGAEGQGREFPSSREVLHEMKEHRRVPLDKLTQRLGLREYNHPAPFRDVDIRPLRVRILLKQHVGEPASPVVSAGRTVERGQKIADVPADKLGVPVHASIGGIVEEVTDSTIIIKRQ